MSILALEGLRILDLTMVFAGPYATKLLGDMGAEIIKVESCVRCDRTRGPLNAKAGNYPDGIPGDKPYNRAAYFNELNRNKYAITLDLTHPGGREVFKKLVRISDAVIENYSARVMQNFGLGYSALQEVKSDLIMVSMPGYGMTGPYRDFVTFGTGIEAMSLSSDLTGYPDSPPLKPGIAYGDPTAGLFAAFAILSAIRYRNRTGNGQYVDLSLRETLTQMFSDAIMDYTMNRRIQHRQGNRHTSVSPHGCYRCKGEDSWIAIAIESDEEWKSFCQAIGNPPWTREARFGDTLSRWYNQDVLNRLIEEWTLGQDHNQAMKDLQAAGVRAAAVLNIKEILSDPQYAARGYFQTIPHAATGTYPYPGIAWQMGKTPGNIRRPAPLFAEHNDFVLGEILGLSAAERDALKQEGVIGDEPTGPGIH